MQFDQVVKKLSVKADVVASPRVVQARFGELLAVVDLGGYRLSGFPFPWSCWAIVSDGGAFGLSGRVVPSLLLLPMTRWLGDPNAVEAWAGGTYVGPDDAVLRIPEAISRLEPEERPRYPGPYGLQGSHDAGVATLRSCLERVRSGPSGVRDVARSHPWTLLFDPVLSASAEVLGLPIERLMWPEGSARVLQAALAVSPGRGRPRKAPELDRSLALLIDVGWLRRVAGAIRRTMADFEALLDKGDARFWPRHGSVGAASGTKYKPALAMTQKRLDDHGARSTLVPFVEDAWQADVAGAWCDSATTGPCAEGLSRWIRAPHIGAVLRVVAGVVPGEEYKASPSFGTSDAE